MLKIGIICNNCGIVKNNCIYKNKIYNSLDLFFIPVINDIIINFLQCQECSTIIHKLKECCEYMCECEDFECIHFLSECLGPLKCDINRMICL
jgi:hypothetical protein